MEIQEALDLVDEARLFWTFEEDPGIGIFPIGSRLRLRVENFTLKKAAVRKYALELVALPGHAVCMSFDWDLLHTSLLKPPRIKKEEFDMGKLSIHDADLKEKIRLKCKNDWDLNLTEDQVTLCIHEMEEQRLSLFHNQLWPNKRKQKIKGTNGKKDEWVDRITWDKTIDGYRAVAHRTGRFAGMDAAVFEEVDGAPVCARINVYALDSAGTRQPYTGEARFSEFVQLSDEWVNDKKTGKKIVNSKWAESPYNQLSIAAERQALRKAFQELAGDTDAAEDTVPNYTASHQDREPVDSRGVPEPSGQPERAPKKEAAKKPEKKREKEPEKKREESANKEDSKGKYVGVPKAGFKPYAMYNKEERIVMMRSKGGSSFLALDSGLKVEVSSEGYEVYRSKRSDKFKGGREWVAGDAYYDGATVEDIANSKADEASLWLSLNNGLKVCLDAWGKETKRKEKKKNKKEEAAKKEPKDEGPKEEARAVFKKKTSSQSPTASGDIEAKKEDIDSLDTVEALRKAVTPLLKLWCEKVHGSRLSPRQAYEALDGVLVEPGQPLSLEDYKNLYQSLEDVTKEVRGSE